MWVEGSSCVMMMMMTMIGWIIISRSIIVSNHQEVPRSASSWHKVLLLPPLFVLFAMELLTKWPWYVNLLFTAQSSSSPPSLWWLWSLWWTYHHYYHWPSTVIGDWWLVNLSTIERWKYTLKCETQTFLGWLTSEIWMNIFFLIMIKLPLW